MRGCKFGFYFFGSFTSNLFGICLKFANNTFDTNMEGLSPKRHTIWNRYSLQRAN